MVDLVIRNGLVVDGTGAPPFVGDVAVEAGRIVNVIDVSPGRDGGVERPVAAGAQVVEADGLVVTPGWVDVHTHYDGQATWDPELTPSSWHGVTTTVFGNCSVARCGCRSVPGRSVCCSGSRPRCTPS